MKYSIVFFFISLSWCGTAQEFFPTYGAASNLPQGVLSLKLNNEYYTDVTQARLAQSFVFSYGISSKFEISQTWNFSNHHGYYLPENFIVPGSTPGSLITHGYVNGLSYPYTFENFAVGIKYRFLSTDGMNEHFRMAAYLQLAGGNDPHEVAESSFSGDNSGAAAGLIATYLKNKFAVSVTTGFILPHAYTQADSNIVLNYGNALTYSLSFGYLLLPRHYKTYKQTNINLYAEFVGESYQGMQSITKEGENVTWNNIPSLNSGHYLEFRPAIQFIFNSNTRVDLSMAWLLSGQSYERAYPIYFITLLHNFYL